MDGPVQGDPCAIRLLDGREGQRIADAAVDPTHRDTRMPNGVAGVQAFVFAPPTLPGSNRFAPADALAHGAPRRGETVSLGSGRSSLQEASVILTIVRSLCRRVAMG